MVEAVERAPDGEIFEAVEALQKVAQKSRKRGDKEVERLTHEQRAMMYFDLCDALLRVPDIRKDPAPRHTRKIVKASEERDKTT